MGRNLDSKCSQCRREGEKLFLKGEKCFGPKCPIVRRNYPPGVHGQSKHGGKKSAFGYGKQLREKQKVKRSYGLMERQFSNYVELARHKKGDAGVIFRQLLEMRLDNVVFRLGLGKSRAHARQAVGHGLMQVNGKNVDIPSFQVKIGDVISWNPLSKGAKMNEGLSEKLQKHNTPAWLSMDAAALSGKVLSMPQITDFDLSFDTKHIIEFYSR